MIEIILTPIHWAVIIYLAVINLTAFIVYGYDKSQAGQAGASRVSEKTLWVLALLGGSVGSLVAMHLFRHKTKKLSFQAMLALIVAAQILALWFLFGRS